MEVKDFWVPYEHVINNFDDLMKTIKKIMEYSNSKNKTFAWRGQIDADWSLHSSLYRRMCLTKGKILTENEMADSESKILKELHRWGLHSSSETGRLSILNQLAMLQHFGSPTRLIDITFNAWVAVFFAVEEKWNNGSRHPDKDARLFAIDVTGRLINEIEDYRPWEDSLSRPWKEANGFNQQRWTTSVFAWKPSNINGRIEAQNGGFIFGGVPATRKPDGEGNLQFPKTGDVKAGGYWRIEEARKAIPDYHRDSASFNRRCGIGAVRQPILTSSIIIDSRLNR